MLQTKSLFLTGILFVCFLYLISCHKDKTNSNTPAIVWQDRMVQDSAFRMGKWYSVTPWTNQSNNPNLDTIWFINDTLAAWTGFGGNPYTYCKTYFPDLYHIIILNPILQNPTKIDTVKVECAMNAGQDTFGIYWPQGLESPLLELYVKKK